MAQVKWRRVDQALPPMIGDALLTLTLRSAGGQPDPDDACAEWVTLEPRVGNGLFRVEVHWVEQVESETGPRQTVVLKWSRENGATQHRLRRDEQRFPVPPEMLRGLWAWELYDASCDMQLGAHPAGFSEGEGLPGELYGSYPTEAIAATGRTSLRRWDGYCRLSREDGEWSLVEGWDRGRDLGREGLVTFDGQGVDLVLETLVLRLALSHGDRAASLIAGDYWLAPYREAIHHGGSVLLDQAPPEGIVHHYLDLVRIGADTETEDDLAPHFPPLTDLDAADVAYRPNDGCRLFVSPRQGITVQTVKEALDRLCLLDAGDIALVEPRPCTDSLLVRERNGIPPTTVREALELLCGLRARHIPYEPECDTLRRLGVSTVQEALDALCRRLEEIEPKGCLWSLPKKIFWPYERRLFGEMTPFGPGERRGSAEEVLVRDRVPTPAEDPETTDPLAVEAASPPPTRPIPLGRAAETPAPATTSPTARPGVSDTPGTLRLHDVETAALSLRLPPGEHRLPEGLDLDSLRHLDIEGRGPGTRLLLDDAEAMPGGLESLRLAHLELVVSQGDRFEIRRCRQVRLEALGTGPGLTLVLVPGRGDISLTGCRLAGPLTLYGLAGEPALIPERLAEIPLGDLVFEGASGRLDLSHNRLDRLLLGQAVLDRLDDPQRGLEELLGTVFLRDNFIVSGQLQLVARSVQLSNNELGDGDTTGPSFVVAESAVYLGNHAARDDQKLLDLARRSTGQANLLEIVRR